jgi:hypothetical protein
MGNLHQVGALVARPMPKHFCPCSRLHDRIPCAPKDFATNESINGCHVATHVWSTWHLTIHRNLCHVSNAEWSTCLLSVFHCTYHVSYDPSTAPSMCRTTLPHHQYGCAMCHPCNGDMCHSLIGPCVTATSTTHTPSHSTTCTLPHQLYNCTTFIVSFHVALYGLYNHHFFACLAK